MHEMYEFPLGKTHFMVFKRCNLIFDIKTLFQSTIYLHETLECEMMTWAKNQNETLLFLFTVIFQLFSPDSCK